ncbi:SURF1 family protein [Arvimicrobium flavum]|uniref:SURF1 family protein n=1 Tax=Arvimicrobium flavum TaxID=3393320 RepID=UPI00237AB58E|nr:SURF1 family protein [Mesorhizobium shangrilense]
MTGRGGSEAEKASQPLGWRSYAVAAVCLAILLALGTWQVERLQWKEGLLATIETRRTSEPLSLPEVEARFAETADVDYQPVRVAGAFLHDREQHFLATWKGGAGFYVYTPLELADGHVALVNRGFVPYDRKEAATRTEGQVAGEVTVTGLARNPLSGKPSSLVPDNEPAKNVFYWKDLTAMAANAGLDPTKVVPFFIDADATPNPGGLPEGGVTMFDLPNNHLQYAVTWYGLAGALVAVFGVLAWRRRAAARP